MTEKEIGAVTHYYGHINVAIIKLSDSLKVGDSIHIKGHSEDYTQEISSMQIEHEEVQTAAAGESVGIKVVQKTHPNDKVFKVVA